MPTLDPTRIEKLLAPYASPSEEVLGQLSAYLELLVKWNARTNLTAVRDPEEMVARHFGESLFAAEVLGKHLASGATVLDFGSGAGFPGLPIQLARPDLRVTLAESQNKKASFLREAIRTLGLTTEVFAARVETMPAGKTFDSVTMRAVDNMAAALEAARPRVAPSGILCVLAGGEESAPQGFGEIERHEMPQSRSTAVVIYRPL